MERPLVAHLIDELPRDGAEMLILDLMRHRHPDLRYVIGCLDAGGPLQQEFEAIGIPVVIFGRRGRLDPGLVLRLVRWMRRERVSVAHSHLFTADAYGRLAARIAGVPWIFSTAHNVSTPGKGRVHQTVDRLLAGFTDTVIGCSEEVTKTLRERDRIPTAKLRTIANGIDLSRFLHADGSSVRAEFGIPEQNRLIGIVGRLHQQKAHDDLLRALAALPQALRERSSCLVVGTGPLREALEAQVEALGLQRQVIFTGSRADVPRLLAAFDVFVLSSKWEGLPIALLEAMGCARATLCTRVGGIPDVIVDSRNGMLVDAGDVAGMAQALTTLLEDSELCCRLGQQARETVLQHFDIRRTADAYNQLHARALAADPSPSKV